MSPVQGISEEEIPSHQEQRRCRTPLMGYWGQKLYCLLKPGVMSNPCGALLLCSGVLPGKKKSGQSGTGLVTNKMRPKKIYCPQRWRQVIRAEKKGEKDAKEHKHFLLLPWSPEDPYVPGWRDRERQYPVQFGSLVRTAVEKSRLRTWLSPAVWQVSNEVFVDKIWVQFESLSERGRSSELPLIPLSPLL